MGEVVGGRDGGGWGGRRLVGTSASHGLQPDWSIYGRGACIQIEVPERCFLGQPPPLSTLAAPLITPQLSLVTDKLPTFPPQLPPCPLAQVLGFAHHDAAPAVASLLRRLKVNGLPKQPARAPRYATVSQSIRKSCVASPPAVRG
jgi:hypothetical protein